MSVTSADLMRPEYPEGPSRMNRTLSLVPWVVAVLGVGLIVGSITVPGGWYADLAKPAFNPPPWVFGPVWTVLYVMIAIAGWRTWRRDGAAGAMQLWWAQMLLNFLWTPVYFGMHQIGLALVVILLLLACILAFVILAWKPDRVSASIFAVYASWVAFASLLNVSIFLLN